MNLNDIAADFTAKHQRSDPFDMLDIACNLIVSSLKIAAERQIALTDIAPLLEELAEQLDRQSITGEEGLGLYYLAAKLRENAKDGVD